MLETGAVTLLFQGAVHRSTVLRVALYGLTQGAYLLLLLPFLTRILRLRRSPGEGTADRWISWLLILYFTGMTLVFFGDDRFRLPILPWMILEVGALAAACGAEPDTAPKSEPRSV